MSIREDRHGLFSTPIMNSSLSITQQLLEVHRMTLDDVFCARPVNASFAEVLSNLDLWLSRAHLDLQTPYEGLSAGVIRQILRSTLYAHLMAHLPALVDMACDHLQEIESGIVDGTYCRDENLDLGDKKVIADAFVECVAQGVEPMPIKTLVLVVLSAQGKVKTHVQPGAQPGAETAIIDCMDGDAVVLDHRWEALVSGAFTGRLPSFVHIEAPATDESVTP